MKVVALASLATMAGIANAYSQCGLDCMANASTTTPGCADNYNETGCLCSAEFASNTRHCMYPRTECHPEIIPWYNDREAACGSLAADLQSSDFVPSNGNSSYDLGVANGTVSSTSLAPAASSASGSALASASAVSGSGSSSAAAVSSSAAASGGAAASSAAASASPSSAARMGAGLGGKEMMVGAVSVGGAIVGSLLLL